MPENTWESEEEFIGEMLLSGAATRAYRDEDDELIFEWNGPLLQRLYPEVYKVMLDTQVEETLSDLVDKGLVEMAVTETESGGIEPVYSLTDAGKKAVEEMSRGFDIPE